MSLNRNKAFRVGKPPRLAKLFGTGGGNGTPPANRPPGSGQSPPNDPNRPSTPSTPQTPGEPDMGYPKDNGNGCGPRSQFLPNCKVKGYTAYLPEVSEECAAAAEAAGKELCVTHAGAELLDQDPATAIPFEITVPNATAFWAQQLVICVFENGTQTPVNNGVLEDVKVRGSSQFAGTNVALCTWNVAMPFLGVAWDMADNTNKISGSMRVRAAGNVDVTIGTVGYAIR